MDELVEMFPGKQDSIMARGTKDFFKILGENIEKPKKDQPIIMKFLRYLMKIRE